MKQQWLRELYCGKLDVGDCVLTRVFPWQKKVNSPHFSMPILQVVTSPKLRDHLSAKTVEDF